MYEDCVPKRFRIGRVRAFIPAVIFDTRPFDSSIRPEAAAGAQAL